MSAVRRRWSEDPISLSSSNMASCSHIRSIEIFDLPDEIAGCEECLKLGMQWVHLRMCQACGHIGCCDNSPKASTPPPTTPRPATR